MIVFCAIQGMGSIAKTAKVSKFPLKNRVLGTDGQGITGFGFLGMNLSSVFGIGLTILMEQSYRPFHLVIFEEYFEVCRSKPPLLARMRAVELVRKDFQHCHAEMLFYLLALSFEIRTIADGTRLSKDL